MINTQDCHAYPAAILIIMMMMTKMMMMVKKMMMSMIKKMMMITAMMNRLCNQMASRADWDLSHEIATTSVQTCKKRMNQHECTFCLGKISTKTQKCI